MGIIEIVVIILLVCIAGMLVCIAGMGKLVS